LVILLLLAIGGSVAAVAAAIGRSELSERLLRFALIPAGVATVALALGLVGAVALTALIFTEAPQVSSSPPVHIVILLVIVAAVALALAALRRGIEAARGGVSAA
jgi:subtilase family serine protease